MITMIMSPPFLSCVAIPGSHRCSGLSCSLTFVLLGAVSSRTSWWPFLNILSETGKCCPANISVWLNLSLSTYKLGIPWPERKQVELAVVLQSLQGLGGTGGGGASNWMEPRPFVKFWRTNDPKTGAGGSEQEAPSIWAPWWPTLCRRLWTPWTFLRVSSDDQALLGPF